MPYIEGMSRDIAHLPVDLRKRLTAELSSGERVLFAAMPDWRAEWGQHLVVVLFGIGWMSICVPMAILVWADALGIALPNVKGGMGPGMSIFFSLFMIPFLLIGSGFLIAPILAARAARHTVHAVTDQRLINLVGGNKPKSESFKLDTINFIKRRDRKDGSGTLQIGYGVEKDSEGDPRPLTTSWPGIPDAQRAEAVIREHAKWAR